jgi:hypothetical protein
LKATGIPGFGRGGPCRGWHRTGEPEHLTQSLSPSSLLEVFEKYVQRKFCSATRRKFQGTTSNKTLKTCAHKLFWFLGSNLFALFKICSLASPHLNNFYEESAVVVPLKRKCSKHIIEVVENSPRFLLP